MIYLAPRYLPILQSKGIANYAQLSTACQGEIINDSGKNTTWRDHWQFENEDFRVYIKRYQYPLTLRYLYPRIPRALVEMNSYLYWQQCGIPGPEVIAAGAHNQFGFHRSSLIITREIRAAQDLVQLCGQPGFYQDQALLTSVFDQLADILATAHQARFYHFDLHFRNIMVARPEDKLPPRVYWIDSPRGKRKSFASRYLQAKDLACLYRACHEQHWPQMWQRLSARYYDKMAYDQATINRLKKAISRRLSRRADTREMNDPI
jgi:tRNA A-37 threonylcarbamoyl transferase component Bud32